MHYDFVAGKPVSHPLFVKGSDGAVYYYMGARPMGVPIYRHFDGRTTREQRGAFGTPVVCANWDAQQTLIKSAGADHPNFWRML